MKCGRCFFDNPGDTRFCGQCGVPLFSENAPESAPSLTETMQTPRRDLSIGSILAGRYQVIEELGRGGMGKVYKVLDKDLEEKVALKLLKPEIASDEETIARFRNELKVARQVAHPNVCRMFDFGRAEGTFFLTMEYIPGEDLKTTLARVGPLSVGKALAVIKQVCQGLAEAHRLGVVHRDLKPQNVMLDREGQAHIMDFGIARTIRTKGLTGMNVMIGTPEYMSPEQVEGKDVDARSDIYSLGIILFELLTGKVPFEGESTLAVALKQKTQPPPDPRQVKADLPVGLSALILKCLDKDKARRPHSAEDVLSALAEVERAFPATDRVLPRVKPSTAREITVKFTPKKLMFPALAAAAVVAAGLLVLFLVPRKAPVKRSIAVIGFKNQTGDTAYDYLQEAIPNLLITSLEQSRYLRVTTWERLKDVLKQMGKNPSTVIDEDLGFELCHREGIEAIVLGSFVKAGDMFATDVKVLEVSGKTLLKSVGSRGEGVGSILKSQIDELSLGISKGIGVRERTAQTAPRARIAEVTTGSMEAYNYFLRGRDEYDKFYLADAQRFLKKALELDPTFAAAHLYLAFVDWWLVDEATSVGDLEKAKIHSGKASEKERLYIEAEYAARVEKDPGKSQALRRELVEKYPEEKRAHCDLGTDLRGEKKYPQALREYRRALELDPDYGSALNELGYLYIDQRDFPSAVGAFEKYAAVSPGDANPLDSMAEVCLRLGDLEKAAAKYREAIEVKPDFFTAYGKLAYVLALQEDYPEAVRWTERLFSVAPTVQTKVFGNWYRGFFRYLLGRSDEALADFAEVRERLKIDTPNAALYAIRTLGYMYCDQGDFERARQTFDSYRTEEEDTDPETKASRQRARKLYGCWVDLKQGRLAQARATLAEIKPLFASLESTPTNRPMFRPTLIESEILLAEGRTDQAIALAEKNVPEEMWNLNGLELIYNLPLEKDVLARAYWKKGEPDKAIAEYKKWMTIDPSNQFRFLIPPRYHYRLGRLYEEKGMKFEAREQYQKFLAFWKDADPRFPEPADARRRLLSLE